MAVGLILVLSQANAYTTENLVSDGWSLVSSLENNKDYVYVFVDAGAQETAMVRGATQDARPRYNTICNPILNKQEVWAIEKYGDNYAILGIEDNYYFSTGDAGWNDSMTDGVDGNQGLFSFTLSGEKYDIRSVAVTGDNNYMGPWNNEGSVDLTGSRESHDGTVGDGMEDIAVNKSYANAPGYRLYKMSKTDYLQKYLQQYPNLEAPIDVSYLILNSKIYQGGAATELPWGWSNYDGHDTQDGRYTESTNDTRLCAYRKIEGSFFSEKSGKLDFDYYTSANNLPKGKYRTRSKVYVTEHINVYLYICGASKESVSIKNQKDVVAETGYLDVSAGSDITFGMEADETHKTNSTHTLDAYADNFQLQVNPYLSTMATELSFPGSTSLTAGVWYYYDIPATNTYDFTSSAAATIYYTQAADPLLDASTTSEAFTTGQTKTISLSSGRVYFKASEATTFSVEYRYNVGAATLSNANGSYIQNSTFTVTYPEAATNDPSASIALVASSKATVNGIEVALSAVTNGFSLDLGSLTANTDYHIVIPAGVYGYDGESMNAAIDVTIHTPAIFDGVYYLYNTWTESYLSRSGAYGTAAIVDNKGLAVHITTDASNNTKLKFFDNLLFVGYNGFCYGDVQDEDALKLNATAVPGGYKFLNTSNSAYFAVFNGHTVGDAVEGDNLQGTSNIWALESTSEHIANYTVNANVQAAEAASNIPSLSSITTKAELDAELTANYNETPIAITGSKNEKYQEYAGADYELVENEYYKETIENLTPGLYKLSVDAFQRAAWNDWVTNADGARGTIYLYANGAKTQLKSVFEYGANEAYTQGTNPNYESKGLNYPNSKEAGYAALETGNYKNEVYVYVPDNGEGKGTLVIGINNPTRQGYEVKNGTWAVYDNWTLTYYDQTAANMTITSAKYATFVAPFDVEIPSGVTAYTVDDVASNGSTLEMTEVTSGPIEKNTPVVLYSESTVNETFYGKTVDGTPTEGLLTGVYERTAVPNGSYVLQNNGGKVGFYLVDTSVATPSVNANRAYLTAPALVKLNAFFFDDGTATAIQSIFDGAESGEVYDIAGRKLGKLQKGVNIVNGKKVVVK